MNSIIATGRLVHSAELTQTQNGKSRIRFSLAVMDTTSRVEEQRTLFLNCYCFEKEKLVQYLEKGKPVTIQGRLTSYDYIAKDGTRRREFQVIVNEIELMPQESAKKASPSLFETSKSKAPKTAGTYTKEGFTPASPDDYEDVPF